MISIYLTRAIVFLLKAAVTLSAAILVWTILQRMANGRRHEQEKEAMLKHLRDINQ
jgi:hypothetical protein